MAYQRKTRDTWQLRVNYGQGFEHELTEDSWKEMKERLREYRENCPQYPAIAVKVRERLKLDWIPANVGCYWHAGHFTISTYLVVGTGESGYELLKDRNLIGRYPTFEAAAAAAEEN